MSLLNTPWKVSRRGECLYVYAPGEVCLNIESGTPEDRARVMRLLEQLQAGLRVLRRVAGGSCNCVLGADEALCERCAAEKALRDAGVMSDSDGRGEG